MLAEEIEMLRGQMQDMTAREEAMLAGLANTLQNAEQRLLAQVREIADRHTSRRFELIEELRALAGNLGVATQAREIDPDMPSQGGTVPSTVTYDASVLALPLTGGGGSWRDASRMIGDDEDADLQHLLRANAR